MYAVSVAGALQVSEFPGEIESRLLKATDVPRLRITLHGIAFSQNPLLWEVLCMFRSRTQRVSTLFALLFFCVGMSFSMRAYAGCRDEQSCSPEISGRLSVTIDLRNAAGVYQPTLLNTTVSFKGRFVTVTLSGLQPGLYRAQIKSARGFATISSGPNSAPERIALTHRGKNPNVTLAFDNTPRLPGPQSTIDFTIEVLRDLVLPMASPN